jgi:plastocyanin
MKRSLYVGGIAGLLVGIGALSVGASSASTPPKARTAASTVPVSGKEFSFRLGTKSVGRPSKVTFTFRNTGHVLHDFKIDGKRTPLIGPGKTARVVVTFKKKGRYTYECTVPGHAAAGMKGVFTVR